MAIAQSSGECRATTATRVDPGRVAVLMATCNGAAFVDEQLRSVLWQSHPFIDVWVSDDGSTDTTPQILADWATRWHKGLFIRLDGPRKGFAENFRKLICQDEIEADYFAFCDQDDLWEPEKLERALDWMRGQDQSLPLLFCSRTCNVSERGDDIGRSPLFRRAPSFQNALVQSLAGGNTMVFNRAARDVLARASRRASFVSHDWWTYLLVTGSGGLVEYSPVPLVRYRQHGRNQVGANTSWRARLSRLQRLLAGQFAAWTDCNLQGLESNRDLMTQEAVRSLQYLASTRSGHALSRLVSLHRSGAYRQTAAGNLVLWGATFFGRL